MVIKSNTHPLKDIMIDIKRFFRNISRKRERLILNG